MKTPDTFILNHLSNGITIGGAEYYVAWVPKGNYARIVVQLGLEDDPLETLMTQHLVGEEGKPLEFSCELEAHAFLLKLKEEVD